MPGVNLVVVNPSTEDVYLRSLEKTTGAWKYCTKALLTHSALAGMCIGLGGLRRAAVVHLNETGGDSGGGTRSTGGSGSGGTGSSIGRRGRGRKAEREDDRTCRAHKLASSHPALTRITSRYVLVLPPSARLTWTSNIRALQLTLDPLDNGARLPVETMLNVNGRFSKCTCIDSSTCGTNKLHSGKTWCYTREKRCGGGWSWEYCSKVNNPPASSVGSSTGSGSSGDGVGGHADGGKQKEQMALDDRSTHAKAQQVIAVGGGRYDAEGILTLP